MDKIATISAAERSELFSETAISRGMTAAIVEKDFWVTWTLDKLFAHPPLAHVLMFKGGTSLSKVFGLIERFSEDIDLILDWTILTGENPEAARSKSKQEKLNRAINEQAQAFIAGELLPMVTECIAPICQCEVDRADPHVLNIRYPGAFSDTYLRPEVRLEIGPLASWLPFSEYMIRPYAAEAFPAVFERVECQVKAIRAERTFWEKATILHHEANRPGGSAQPPRNSRHYYDLAKMATSSVRELALANLDLLAGVVEFKQRFYPRGWARYDLAKPGTLRLVPDGHVLAAVQADYREMKNMIFGEYLTVEEILARLQSLESEINGMSS
ncbi:protein of unknown function DUF1814 [Syntrophotalea carbinolica DSM 2380]|uniref:Nucleotidyl transferase AbiEii/AbiGii toxin family protein n=1 Tax=Syntrophotalea carbinolica (strain DSM 2380 / NBRC 103641 / GraBd1) TaxID=338963 RepID=Q3A7V2_SYNC1|nr:nucleotidyl transferase AbiEii/AbiGii toxin family protein [Syntrophotalea carbinolica]ABA87542.1 protein of unknown function DUF1814 [Syntrophotalea carbinolica DSM 2380]